jgi:hypothetical protein
MREVLLQSALVFTLAGSWLAPALSEEVKIGHLETNDDTGINWIYFICNTSEDRLRMQCQTFQTMIYKKKTQAQVDEAITEQASRPALEEFNAEIGSACSNLVKMNVDQAMSNGTGFDGRPINKRVVLAGLGLLKDTIEVCHHPSEESARALLTEIVKNDLRVCQVHSSSAEEYFEWKEASHSWVSQQGPTGICGTVAIGVLTQDPNNHYWNYVQKNIRTNPNGAGFGLKCSAFPDFQFNYTWKTTQTLEGCELMESLPD